MDKNISRPELSEKEKNELTVYEIFPEYAYFVLFAFLVGSGWTAITDMPYFLVVTVGMVYMSFKKTVKVKAHREKTGDAYPFYLNEFYKYFGVLLSVVWFVGCLALFIPSLRDWVKEFVFVL